MMNGTERVYLEAVRGGTAISIHSPKFEKTDLIRGILIIGEGKKKAQP